MIGLAQRLIEIGARLTTVRTLTGISERDSCHVYREVTGKRPATGGVPTSTSYFLSTPLIQFHTSAFYSFYQLTKKSFPNELLGTILIEAYSSYKEFAIKSHHEVDLIDIDRAFVLIQAVDTEDLVFRKCSGCHSHYIGAHRYGEGCCPVCASLRRETCSSCGDSFTNFTLYPKDRAGRYSTVCPDCREAGAKPKRKSRSTGYLTSGDISLSSGSEAFHC